MRSQRGNRSLWPYTRHRPSPRRYSDASLRELVDGFGHRHHITRCTLRWIRLYRIHGAKETRTLRTTLEHLGKAKHRIHSAHLELLRPTERSCRLRSSHTLQTNFAKTGYGHSSGGLSGPAVCNLHGDLAAGGQADFPLLAWWYLRGQRWRYRQRLVCMCSVFSFYLLFCSVLALSTTRATVAHVRETPQGKKKKGKKTI